MSMQQILDIVRGLDEVVELAPCSGSDFPEIAWGDHFFYHSPDGTVPQTGQGFATIVTKNYPGDDLSELDQEGRWRLNIHVGRDRLDELTAGEPVDPATVDRFFPHPVYARQGWVSIIDPSPASTELVTALLTAAHAAERNRQSRPRRR